MSYLRGVAKQEGSLRGIVECGNGAGGRGSSGLWGGLKAEVRKQGVVLSWTADGENAAVRLQAADRSTAARDERPSKGLLAPPPEAIHETLLVDASSPAGPGPWTRLFALGRAMNTGRSA